MYNNNNYKLYSINGYNINNSTKPCPFITVNWYHELRKLHVAELKLRSHTHRHTHEKSPLWIQSPEATSIVWIHGSRFSVPVPDYTQLTHTHAHTHTHTHTRTHTHTHTHIHTHTRANTHTHTRTRTHTHT